MTEDEESVLGFLKPKSRNSDHHNGRNLERVARGYFIRPGSAYKRNDPLSCTESCFDDTESAVSTIGVSEVDGGKTRKHLIYDKYDFSSGLSLDLPISESKIPIIEAIRQNKAIILQGDTGCGKTTQVPQYILQDAYNRREYCNIICTQPRRIAAINIASRVCSERKWNIGGIVGYQVGLHKVASEDTRLLYCTTGILLQKLIQSKDMSHYTHVILDEVHERTQEMDFLLIIIRRFLSTNSPNTKVILMSATIDTREFSEYFIIPHKRSIVPAPVINIDSRRMFIVKEFYLCQLDKLYSNSDIINYEEPGISDEMYKIATKLIIICEKLDKDDKGMDDNAINYKPSILVFLPGINEIDKMEGVLMRAIQDFNEIKLLPLRLHSTVTHDEQQKVFRQPPPGYRKIILSTNIAESSVTVPDVKYVIDFCLTKCLVTDSRTNWSSLQLQWASQNNCKQRSGRAGRVMDGRVYRLVSKYFFEAIMTECNPPEILRCPLENVVLNTKLLDLGPPLSILTLAMNPPSLSDIRNTILILKELGALFKTVNGSYEIYDGDLTFIGRVMASLPVDVRISRLIIFGYIFSVLDETIIMGAGLNLMSIFQFPYDQVLQSYSQKLAWAHGSGSDLFAIHRAYRAWLAAKHQRFFDDDNSEYAWARRNFLNVRALREVHSLADEIRERLKEFKIIEAAGENRVNWTPKEKAIILKIVIAGAFHPNYFVREKANSISHERDIYHAIADRNPYNTVFLSGFDSKYLGIIYTKAFQEMFRLCTPNVNNIKVSFDRGAQKIYITFMDAEENEDCSRANLVPGRVKADVYKAIKIKKNRQRLQIKVLNPTDAIEYATHRDLGSVVNSIWTTKRMQNFNPEMMVTPSTLDKLMRGRVTHIEHCNKFWFQPSSEDDNIAQMTKDLNGPESDISPFNHPSEVSKGLMVAALFSEPGGQKTYYRARILKLENMKNKILFKVMFIDIGNLADIEFEDLRKFGSISSYFEEVPPRVFQCYLTEIEPALISSPNGRWTEEAKEFMHEFVDRGPVELEIYSVVHDVCSVILHQGGDNLNELLIQKGFGQICEENYLSKEDHDLRMRKQITSSTDYNCDVIYNHYDYEEAPHCVDLPPPEKCRSIIHLKGPFSPLETSVSSCSRAGIYKTVSIESQSVNSVFLDSDPQDNRERYVVAASINEITDRSEITARQTTLLPNINGFGPLMAMIFCPTMELKRDKYKTKYISVLTGLGCDDEKKPFFREHDAVFNLEVEITNNDLETINKIRYTMDKLLYTSPENDLPYAKDRNLTKKIKDLIVKLLEKPRNQIEMHNERITHNWEFIEIDRDFQCVDNILADRAIFPLHSSLRLYPESLERLESLREHAIELRRLSRFNYISIQPTKCQLCEQIMENITELRIHLLSQMHRDRELQVGYSG